MRLHRHLRRPGPSAATLVVGAACRLACALAVSALLAACGSGDTGGPDAGASCTKSSQCGVGEGCIGGHCTQLPCGGCQPDELCQDSGSCTPAQGARCPTAGCPAGFKCNKAGVCSKPCLLDGDCGDPKLVCNSATGTCAQCIFDSQCTKVAGKPRCDSSSGNCVACLQPLDCTSALGSGHFCDQTTHACGVGCRDTGDCDPHNSERCDGATASAPGKCVQCTAATEAQDCAGGVAPACDATGKCVICTADKYCGSEYPRCDTTTQTCVECVPAHNATGEDCGTNAVRDPHDEKTCDPAAKACVDGCASDAQCGCPIDPGTHLMTDCSLRHSGLHCDPALTTMPGVGGGTLHGTLGGCVECVANVDCHCKVKGSTGSTAGCDADWPSLGALNGARCVKDTTTGWGACQAGCDANADCPSGKLCSLSGQTAHTCVECSCAGGVSADGTWCDDPIGKDLIGGCPQSGPSSYKVCDAKTLTCRLKRQNEECDASKECGDTTKDPSDPTHPWYGQCIPGAQFCIKSAHSYALPPVDKFCDPGKNHGRCGIGCDDVQANTCDSGAGTPCPSGSFCGNANAIDKQPSETAVGKYCTSNLCNTP